MLIVGDWMWLGIKLLVRNTNTKYFTLVWGLLQSLNRVVLFMQPIISLFIYTFFFLIYTFLHDCNLERIAVGYSDKF